MQGPDLESMQAVRDSTRKVLKQNLLPVLEEQERKGEFALGVHREMGKLQLLAPMFSEPFGMNDLWLQYALADEFGYYSSGYGLSSLASTCLFGANVDRYGTTEQKENYLPQIANGEKIGCWALTEPERGSDALGIQTRCVRDGADFVINGSKTFITNAPIADYFLVIAREFDGSNEPVGKGMKGGVCFLLERGIEGLTTGSPFKKMGHLSSPTGEVFLNDVRVSETAVLGEVGNAFKDMKHSLDVERIIFSGLGLGMMRFCIDQTLNYTKERKQFGQAISEFQMIRDMVAQMSCMYETSRAVLEESLGNLVAGKDVNHLAAVVKLQISESVAKVANLAVQCHGGYGYMQEYHVERYLRDAKLFEIGAGTSQVQKLIIASTLYKGK